MAIRLRHIEGTGLIALCAARSIAKAGDIYLDDSAHHALSVKFTDDFASMGFLNFDPAERDDDPEHPDAYIRRAVEAEESNNPNRDWWDKEYGTA